MTPKEKAIELLQQRVNEIRVGKRSNLDIDEAIDIALQEQQKQHEEKLKEIFDKLDRMPLISPEGVSKAYMRIKRKYLKEFDEAFPK